MRNYLTEAIGTFFLVLTIGLTVTAGLDYAPIPIGCVLMVMLYMGGHVSGAHYNPAVTLAVFLRGKCAAKDVVPYMIAQIAAATLAAWIVYLFMDKTFAPLPAAGIGPGKVFLAEFLFTFALCLVVLNSATAVKTEGNSFYGLAIGFTVLAGAFAVGGISGGSFNPAVSIGPTIIHGIFDKGPLSQLWVYLLAQLVAGAVAAVVFRIQNPAGEEALTVALRKMDVPVVGTQPERGDAPAAAPDAPIRDGRST